MENVLFFASSPPNTPFIRFDSECREIRKSLYKSHLNLESRLDTHIDDLVPNIIELSPKIIHFSCHSSAEGMFLTENGVAKLINPRIFGRIIKRICSNTKIIVLNTCFSKFYADEIADSIDTVIFFPSELRDEDAITFSREFYCSLARKMSVKDAYDNAIKILKTSDCKIVHQIITH